MSYSRWSTSNWYAFHCSAKAQIWQDEELALWHCAERAEGEGSCRDWKAGEVLSADAAWVRERFPGISDDDVAEALDIIKEFLADVKPKEPT
ncbi:MAG: hypothetical protein V2A79_14845 [Planctomycetota bacterium]